MALADGDRTWDDARRYLPDDRRGRIVRFTPSGLKWLDAFRKAVDLAEKEMRAELGKATMDALLAGLTVYGAAFDTLAD